MHWAVIGKTYRCASLPSRERAHKSIHRRRLAITDGLEGLEPTRNSPPLIHVGRDRRSSSELGLDLPIFAGSGPVIHRLCVCERAENRADLICLLIE